MREGEYGAMRADMWKERQRPNQLLTWGCTLEREMNEMRPLSTTEMWRTVKSLKASEVTESSERLVKVTSG